jgi:hypothetical protein
MKLIAALFCVLPVMASSVTYSVLSPGVNPASPAGAGFVFTAPDWFPNVPSEQPGVIHPAQTSYYSCGALPQNIACDGSTFFADGSTTRYKMSIYVDPNYFTIIDATFVGPDLYHVGSWLSVDGRSQLTISAIDAPPTLAPEPSSIMLGLLGFGLIGVKYSRRLLHRAVDSKVIISSGR